MSENVLLNAVVAVCSRSFSKNNILCENITSIFPNVTYHKGSSSLAGGDLIRFLQGKEVAILGLEKISSSVLDACPELKIICKMGTGTDKIDLQELKKRGIAFYNTPGFNKHAVAELVLSHALILSRRIMENVAQTKSGVWKQIIGNEIGKKRVGIMGYGAIGQEVSRLFQAFGCAVSAFDINKELVLNVDAIEYLNPEELFSTCDLVSVHIPLNEITKAIVNKKLIYSLKLGSIFINTSRGAVVDQYALMQRLNNREIFAGLDVLESEPNVDFSLANQYNVLLTPHIGGSTFEAIEYNGASIISYLKSNCIAV